MNDGRTLGGGGAIAFDGGVPLAEELNEPLERAFAI
jgi:hypothetical protein